jgi:hypothetical protein
MLTDPRRRSPLASSPLVLLLAIAACGCRRMTTVASVPEGTRIVSLTNKTEDGGFRATVAWNEAGAEETIDLRIDPDVPASYHTTMAVIATLPPGTQLQRGEGLWLGDARLEVVGGELRIGSAGLGPVTGASLVHLRKSGVFVDEQRRGDLP